MDKNMIPYCIVLMIGVFVSAVSQVMLKKAASREYSSPIKEYLNATVIIAYILFFGTTFLSIIAYKGIPLSMGPVIEATSYIYVTIFGVKIFHERFSRKKCLALILIISGIVIYSFG